ncbi:MAG: alanine:cation symporter family protein [[Clostridium] innocuum]
MFPSWQCCIFCWDFLHNDSQYQRTAGNIRTDISEAFDLQAIFGGFAGSCVMYGIKRGLFSNEAGMGLHRMPEQQQDVSHPVKQGLVQTISVFIDTILICSTTAFMLLNFGIRTD